MKNVYDPEFRAAATSVSSGLTAAQVDLNLAWYVKWDAFCAACEEYDRLAPAALKGDIPIPPLPVKFWGKGKPMVPCKPSAKAGRPPKEMTVPVTLHLPIPLAAQIEESRGEMSAGAYLTKRLTEALSSRR